MTLRTRRGLLVIPCLTAFRAILMVSIRGQHDLSDVGLEILTTAVPISIFLAFLYAKLPERVVWRGVAMMVVTPIVGLCTLAVRQYAVSPGLLSGFFRFAYFPFATWFLVGLATFVSVELIAKLPAVAEPRDVSKSWN